jgi:putative ATP-dependent endonuclease of the OLD family
MHKVSRIQIENFKSIKSGDFIFSEYTPMVGYNNAGKTNILRALEWAVKKSSLPATYFFDPDTPIVVTAEIDNIDERVLENIDEKHRAKIEPLVLDGTLVIRRSQLEPGVPVKQIGLEIFENSDAGPSWKPNPAGIDAAISHLFPDPIFIGAMENATEDVAKFATGTTIGKLLKEIIDPISDRHAGSVIDALDEVAKKLSADSTEKDEDLVKLDESIQNELQKFFPGVSAKTHIPTPEFSDFLKGATIRLFEQDFENNEGRDAASFGHGAQRSVQIALLKCLSDLKRTGAGEQSRTTILLIDEPELYLHPQAVEMIRASLRKLSKEGYQVVFSTHSANMISRHDASNALLVRRNVERGTFAFPRLQEAVRDAIENADHQAETLFSLTNSTKILFSERVILTEGKTEQTLLPELFQSVQGLTFDEAKTALIGLDGVENIPNAKSVLLAMGIPTKAIADLDFIFRGAVARGLVSETDARFLKCLEILKRLEVDGKVSLHDDGLPTAHNGEKAAKAFELMSSEADAHPHIDLLHDSLKDQGIWTWKKGTIETHLGLASKKPSEHMRFLEQINEASFLDELSDIEGIKELLIWLRE